MNNLEKFVKEHFSDAIALKERFKAIEKKEWDSTTVMLELYVQIGHIFDVMNKDKNTEEQGRQIDNLGDEISDVLLQLSYLAYLEGVTFEDADQYGQFTNSEIAGLNVLGGQLTEAILEKYEYRFDKPRAGFASRDDFIKDRIKKMMAIALNLGNKENLDLGLEFSLMCADATNFVGLKTAPAKEMIDVFDKDHNHIGTCEKKEAHKKGLWHQVFACLLIDSKKNKVYLQYKNSGHNDLSTLNKVDISVGGHLLAGETVEDGTREIAEEAGLQVKYSDLIPVGMRLIDKFINENYIIREFSYLHIYDSEFDLNALRSQDDEVLYFIEFDIDELIAYLMNETNKVDGLTPEGYRQFTKKDFIQAYIGDDRLYLKYLLLAKQVMNNEKEVSWKNFH